MSYICEYVRKPLEKSEKVKIACWQPALIIIRSLPYMLSLATQNIAWSWHHWQFIIGWGETMKWKQFLKKTMW